MELKMKPTRDACAEARKHPNGCVCVIEGPYGPNDAVPPEAIIGAWKVDSAGKIVGEFIPNPNYRPRSNKKDIVE